MTTTARALHRLFAASALVGCVLSQQTQDAGLGTVKRRVNVRAALAGINAENGVTGCAQLGAFTYVSGRGGNSAAFAKQIYEFAASGVLVRQFNQPPGVPTNSFGIRDMATDGVSLIGAAEGAGVIVFDLNGNLVNTLQATNGAQPLAANPIGGSYLATVPFLRGVAFDANGNGGNGSLWVCDFGPADPLVEIDLAGNVLRTLPNGGWTAYGLALDPLTNNLWVNSIGGSGGPIGEVDLATGMRTGKQFAQAGEFYGGLDGVFGGDPGSYGSTFDLVAVYQDDDDAFAMHRVHLLPGTLGTQEAVLVGSVAGATPAAGELGRIQDNDMLSWTVLPGATALAGFPAITLFDYGPDAERDWGTFAPFLTGTPTVPELRAATPLNVPQSGGGALLFTSIGAIQSLALPPGVLPSFQLIRIQSYYLDPAAQVGWPFVATNEIWCNHFDEASSVVVVEAVGPNSANNGLPGTATPPQQPPFWRITHRGGPPITRVTFDMSASPNPVVRDTMRFCVLDTFQPGLIQTQTALWRGNANSPTCAGTYRNGSDAATGLVFDALNHPVDPCAAGFNSGFVASNAYTGLADTWRTLTFRFTDFFGTAGAPEVFEFDCDTDGGPGVTGAQMAGIVVEIEFGAGQLRRTLLRVDPSTPNRAVGGL